ncbi:hypothetical protein B2J77_05920 [Pseudomonas parafulva]|uniref:Uncharacterized protein n=1 Tax=Pseudomonas parafulva TaxID=157782 RepID=A0ABM6J086_9PSED|nr:hypothetical protein B2J77_05920 [Pseudomonas parafulva]
MSRKAFTAKTVSGIWKNIALPRTLWDKVAENIIFSTETSNISEISVFLRATQDIESLTNLTYPNTKGLPCLVTVM